MKQRPGRNELCSCGSGRKYKNCCAGKSRPFAPRVLGVPIWVLVAIAGVAVAAFAMLRTERAKETVPSTVPAEERPAPYAYDSLTNRHFDPVHAHWHDGPPPGSAGAAGPARPAPAPAPGPAPTPSASTMPPAAPAPYTYDAEKNQHWDPEHQHWHPGLPPAGR